MQESKRRLWICRLSSDADKGRNNPAGKPVRETRRLKESQWRTEDTASPRERKMAQNVALFKSYLSCHVCSEIFRDPVTLSCSHSFCSSCLQKFWEQTKDKNCPICKRRSSKDHPLENSSLKELADSFAGRQNWTRETDEGRKHMWWAGSCECPVFEGPLHKRQRKKQSLSLCRTTNTKDRQLWGTTRSRRGGLSADGGRGSRSRSPAVEEDLQKDDAPNSRNSSYILASDMFMMRLNLLKCDFSVMFK